MNRELESIRDALLARRAELTQRIERITDDVRHTAGPLSSDFAEQAVEREHEEVLDALGEAGRAELLQIRAALGRIDTGDFGVCLGCGEQIPWKRLEVLPFSDRCVSCAEQRDARR